MQGLELFHLGKAGGLSAYSTLYGYSTSSHNPEAVLCTRLTRDSASSPWKATRDHLS